MKIYTISFSINPKLQPTTIVETRKGRAIEVFNTTLTTLELFNKEEIIDIRKDIAINNLKYVDKEKNQFVILEAHEIKL